MGSDRNKFENAEGKFMLLKGFMECDMNENKSIHDKMLCHKVCYKVIIPKKTKTQTIDHGFIMISRIFP